MPLQTSTYGSRTWFLSEVLCCRIACTERAMISSMCEVKLEQMKKTEECIHMSVLRYYYLILRRNYIFGKKLAPLGRRKETKRKTTKEMD